MNQNTPKHPYSHRRPLTIDEIRKQAQSDANALVAAYDGLNKAADGIGMSRGRLSFIRRGVWTQVAVNEIDLAMLSTGRIAVEKDLSLTVRARELLQQFQAQLSDLHQTSADLIKIMRKL